MRLNCLTNAYADLWVDVYNEAWQTDTWACSWANTMELGGFSSGWLRDLAFYTGLEVDSTFVV